MTADDQQATRGFVKCMLRKYHKNQTMKNMEHRQGSAGVLTTVAWAVVAGLSFIMAHVLRVSGAAAHPFDIVAIVSSLLAANSLLTICGYADAMRCSEENTGFMDKIPEEKPKCECE